MSTELDTQDAQMAEAIRNSSLGTTEVVEIVLAAGYRQVFDGDCGLSNASPDEREAAEAWMRWANLAMDDSIGAIVAMKQMLTEFGYRRPRTVTTVEELDALPVGSVVLSLAYHSDVNGMAIVFQRWYDGLWHRGARSGDTHPDNFLPATVLHEATA